MSCSVCRALPTDAELAAATAPGDALDDLQTYMDAVAKNSPLQPDALNRGVRNRPFESLAERDRLRALGMSEAAAPGLQTMNPLQRLRTAEEVEAMPFVSVLVPTSHTRHWSHSTIYKCFKQQTYPKERREMIVLDTGGAPSPFFTTSRDRSVRYFHVGMPPPAARTVGGKRNWLAGKAAGSILVAFDDDDLYLPDYIDRMVSAMQSSGASVVTLASWLSYDAWSGALGVFDPEEDNLWGHHGRRWGYGFSYVYTADVAREVPFPRQDFGEDYGFILAAAACGKIVQQYADSSPTACCVHVSHGLNTSVVRGAQQLEVSEGGLDAHFAAAQLSGYRLKKLLAAAVEHTLEVKSQAQRVGLDLKPKATDRLGAPLARPASAGPSAEQDGDADAVAAGNSAGPPSRRERRPVKVTSDGGGAGPKLEGQGEQNPLRPARDDEPGVETPSGALMAALNESAAPSPPGEDLASLLDALRCQLRTSDYLTTTVHQGDSNDAAAKADPAAAAAKADEAPEEELPDLTDLTELPQSEPMAADCLLEADQVLAHLQHELTSQAERVAAAAAANGAGHKPFDSALDYKNWWTEEEEAITAEARAARVVIREAREAALAAEKDAEAQSAFLLSAAKAAAASDATRRITDRRGAIVEPVSDLTRE